MKDIRLIFFSVVIGVVPLANSLASECKDRTQPLLARYPALPLQLYATLGHYQGSSLLGYFFPNIIRGETWTWWGDTGTLLDGAGAGVRRLFPQGPLSQDWFLGAYLYYDSFYWSFIYKVLSNYWYSMENPIPEAFSSFYAEGMPPRLNGGFEIGSDQLGQLTTNLYYSLIFSEDYKRHGCTLQKQHGISARYSYPYPIEKVWFPFLSMGYTYIQKQDLAHPSESLFNASIGVRAIWPYFSFEFAMSIPDSIKVLLACISKGEHKKRLEESIQNPIGGFAIQLRLHHDNTPPSYWRKRMNHPPERYTPYPAYLSNTDPVISLLDIVAGIELPTTAQACKHNGTSLAPCSHPFCQKRLRWHLGAWPHLNNMSL